MGTVKTVFPYFGGKAHMVPALVQLMPPHRVYVEVFGGSGVLLINKPRSADELEVYNDHEGDLVNFFRQLRSNTCDLAQALERTMFSRKEYQDAKETLRDASCTDPLERARCFYVLARQSFAATAGTGGWRPSKKVDTTKAWVNSIDMLPFFAERMRRVVIEQLDWKDCLRQYDSPDTLFYLDPPYTLRQRTGGKAYRAEMESFDHAFICQFGDKCKGKVILSGYANPLYDERLSHWDRHVLRVRTSAANAKNQSEGSREEVIWVKPNSRVQMGMWDAHIEDLLEVDKVEVE